MTLYHPNMMEKPHNAVFCFKDANRPCTAECAAFTEPPAGEDYKGKAWANCLVLVSEYKGAKHLQVLAQQGDSLLKHLRNEHHDRQRVGQQSPPLPR